MGTSFEELYSEYTNASLPIFTGDEYYGDMLEAMDSGKHEISLFNRFFEKKIDLKWVEAIEACTVALDTIVRNPRKFIVQEEENRFLRSPHTMRLKVSIHPYFSLLRHLLL